MSGQYVKFVLVFKARCAESYVFKSSQTSNDGQLYDTGSKSELSRLKLLIP